MGFFTKRLVSPEMWLTAAIPAASPRNSRMVTKQRPSITTISSSYRAFLDDGLSLPGQMSLSGVGTN